MKNSPLFTLQWKDAAKALVVAIFSAFLSSLYSILEAGAMPTSSQWQQIGFITFSATVSYLLKNFFTNSEDKFLKTDPK